MSLRPQFVSDSRNNLHLVYDEAAAPWISYKKRENGVWGSRLTLANFMSWVPSPAVDLNDWLHIVWCGDRGGNFPCQEIYYVVNKGLGFSDTFNISRNIGRSSYPSISTDRFRNLYVVWMDMSLDTTRFFQVF